MLAERNWGLLSIICRKELMSSLSSGVADACCDVEGCCCECSELGLAASPRRYEEESRLRRPSDSGPKAGLLETGMLSELPTELVLRAYRWLEYLGKPPREDERDDGSACGDSSSDGAVRWGCKDV